MGVNDSISFRYIINLMLALVLSIAWMLMIALILSSISFKFSMDVNDSISFK